VWDGLLGEAASLSALDASVRALAADRALARSAALAIRTLSIDDWIDEDCVLARSFVYVPAILAAVRRFEREGREGKSEVSLRGAYIEVAIGAARARAVQAAARLRALLSPDTSQGQSLQGSSLQGSSLQRKSPAGHGE
jgi:hypothetical protein